MNKIDFDAINMSDDEDIEMEIIEEVIPETENASRKIYLCDQRDISDVIWEFLRELETNRYREYKRVEGGIDIFIDHINIGEELILVTGTISTLSRMKTYYRKKYIYRKSDFSSNYTKISNHIKLVLLMKLITFSVECIKNKEVLLPEYLTSQRALEAEMDGIESPVYINVE